MTKNLGDLHEYLFKQLERLDSQDLKGEELDKELNRANAVTGIASVMVKNAAITLQASIARSDGRFIPEILKGGESLARPLDGSFPSKQKNLLE